MTARPLDPKRRRWPVSAAVAVVLLLAMAMAAGCVGQSSSAAIPMGETVPITKTTLKIPTPIPPLDITPQTQHSYTITPAVGGKYIFLEHRINGSYVTVSGTCHHFDSSYYCGKTYNMSNSVLTVYPGASGNVIINESLILFYGQQYRLGTGGFDCGKNGWFVYSLPGSFSENITIDSLADDGTVAFRFMDSPVILKPYERWENISSVRYHQDKITFDDGEFFPECTEDYVKVHSIYNAGFLDKRTIVVQHDGAES